MGILGFWATAAAAFNPADVRIESFSVSGQGCPQGSVRLVLAPDASAITVLYDQFQLQGLSGSPQQMDMTCRVDAIISKPKSLGFSIESVDFRGFVQLDRGVRAAQRVKVVSGSTRPLRQLSGEFGFERWVGPIAENYLIQTVAPYEKPEILNCLPLKKNTRLTVTSRIRLNGLGPGKTGFLAVDSADGKVAQRYRLQWHDCAKVIGKGIGDIIRGLGRL